MVPWTDTFTYVQCPGIYSPGSHFTQVAPKLFSPKVAIFALGEKLMNVCTCVDTPRRAATLLGETKHLYIDLYKAADSGPSLAKVLEVPG